MHDQGETQNHTSPTRCSQKMDDGWRCRIHDGPRWGLGAGGRPSIPSVVLESPDRLIPREDLILSWRRLGRTGPYGELEVGHETHDKQPHRQGYPNTLPLGLVPLMVGVLRE